MVRESFAGPVLTRRKEQESRGQALPEAHEDARGIEGGDNTSDGFAPTKLTQSAHSQSTLESSTSMEVRERALSSRFWRDGSAESTITDDEAREVVDQLNRERSDSVIELMEIELLQKQEQLEMAAEIGQMLLAKEQDATRRCDELTAEVNHIQNEMEELELENNVLQRKVVSLTKRCESTQKENFRLTGDLAQHHETKRKLRRAQAELESARKGQKQLKSELKRLEMRNRARSRSSSSGNNGAEESGSLSPRKSRSAQRSGQGDIRTLKRNASEKISSLERRLEEASTEAVESKRALESSRTELMQTQRNLEKIQTLHRSAVESLSAMEGDLSRAEIERDALRQELDKMKIDLEKSQSMLHEDKTIIEELRETNAVLKRQIADALQEIQGSNRSRADSHSAWSAIGMEILVEKLEAENRKLKAVIENSNVASTASEHLHSDSKRKRDQSRAGNDEKKEEAAEATTGTTATTSESEDADMRKRLVDKLRESTVTTMSLRTQLNSAENKLITYRREIAHWRTLMKPKFEVGAETGEFTVYTIDLTQNNETVHTFQKRFSEFLSFRDALKRKLFVSGAAVRLPQLPPKVWGRSRSLSSEVVEERKVQLRVFLDVMLALSEASKEVGGFFFEWVGWQWKKPEEDP